MLLSGGGGSFTSMTKAYFEPPADFPSLMAIRDQGAPPRSSTAFLLRALSFYYHRRWTVGHEHVGRIRKVGFSPFVLDDHPSIFERQLALIGADEVIAQHDVFSLPVYQRSLLGRCRRDLGPSSADVLALVLLADLCHVGYGPMCLREIAWCLSARDYHQQLSVARALVDGLCAAGRVESRESQRPVRSICWPVVPTAATLNEFLDFLSTSSSEHPQ